MKAPVTKLFFFFVATLFSLNVNALTTEPELVEGETIILDSVKVKAWLETQGIHMEYSVSENGKKEIFLIDDEDPSILFQSITKAQKYGMVMFMKGNALVIREKKGDTYYKIINGNLYIGHKKDGNPMPIYTYKQV
ncbi:hypothetical protein [Flexithrix dorotheae]|uniref:hypothetical protein n=1 Tax=Flexithrix dorotheae TaxID=70993 RepID=UPI000376AA29|nr:hypothetical protein [Flexithrix dorotheae]